MPEYQLNALALQEIDLNGWVRCHTNTCTITVA